MPPSKISSAFWTTGTNCRADFGACTDPRTGKHLSLRLPASLLLAAGPAASPRRIPGPGCRRTIHVVRRTLVNSRSRHRSWSSSRAVQSVDPDAAGQAVVHVELGDHGDLVAHRVADQLGDLPGPAESGCRCCRCTILAPVDQRARNELGRQVAEMQFDGVETRVDGDLAAWGKLRANTVASSGWVISRQ